MGVENKLNKVIGMRLQDFDTLAQAQAYVTTQPKLIHRDSMNSLLASAGLYVGLKAIAQDTASPFQNLISAFLDSTDYNFMIGNSTGDSQIAALDSIISAGGDLGAAMSSIRPLILGMANPTYRPFELSNKHDFDLAKGTITRKPVTQTDGILTITTTADCETHNPQVYQYIESADFYKRVAGFRGVGVAGKHQIEVPRVSNLFVDDAYGVVS
jgi:hypothetical protein